jgi:hypothetical protein
MTRDEAIRKLRAHERDLRARGVTYLALFGSVARGEAGPESDVDIAVDIAPGRRFSLIDLASVQALLSDVLGCETDVVVREDMGPRLRGAALLHDVF